MLLFGFNFLFLFIFFLILDIEYGDGHWRQQKTKGKLGATKFRYIIQSGLSTFSFFPVR
jgi:hypothetical protein